MAAFIPVRLHNRREARLCFGQLLHKSSRIKRSRRNYSAMREPLLRKLLLAVAASAMLLAEKPKVVRQPPHADLS